ncbi:MAG: amidohydrolase family protein, partial [Acidimicrobiales bacterium]
LMTELRRARDELDMKGALIFTNIDGLPLDDESMWPLYEEAAASGLPIWIHPQDGHSYPWVERDRVDLMFGWPFETSLAMARLVFGGVVGRFPSLRFVTHHLGGMVPFYAGRIDSIRRRHRPNRPAADDTSSSSAQLAEPETMELFRSFFADAMVTGWQPGLRCGLDFFGPERVVYGSDFPMGLDGGEADAAAVLDSIRELDLSESERELILAGNARRLLGFDGPAPTTPNFSTGVGAPVQPRADDLPVVKGFL